MSGNGHGADAAFRERTILLLEQHERDRDRLEADLRREIERTEATATTAATKAAEAQNEITALKSGDGTIVGLATRIERLENRVSLMWKVFAFIAATLGSGVLASWLANQSIAPPAVHGAAPASTERANDPGPDD